MINLDWPSLAASGPSVMALIKLSGNSMDMYYF